MQLSDGQRALLEQRLDAIGVTRRHCLKVIAALVATGTATSLAEAGPPELAPGERLARQPTGDDRLRACERIGP
jgi:hypothetical protein